MSNTVPTPIIDKNGKKTTVHKKAAVSSTNRIPSAPKRWENPDDPTTELVAQYDFMPKPKDFVRQEVEHTSVRDNPAIIVTFPDAPNLELILVADPGDQSYWAPAITTVLKFKDDQDALRDYIEGGQDYYGSPAILRTEDGKILATEFRDEDNEPVDVSTLKSKKRTGGVPAFDKPSDFMEFGEQDPAWVDSYGNSPMKSILSNLSEEASSWLLENAPVYVPTPKSSDSSQQKWVGENPDYGSSRVESHNAPFGRK